MDIPAEARERIVDEEHLRLLGIGHYITGGFTLAFASIFVFHFLFLLAAASDTHWFPGADGMPGVPHGMLRVFAAVVGAMILAGWTFGGLTLYAGRCIQRRTHRAFTIVMACLNTLFIPFGTVLGVFTLIVLSRPSVKRLYG